MLQRTLRHRLVIFHRFVVKCSRSLSLVLRYMLFCQQTLSSTNHDILLSKQMSFANLITSCNLLIIMFLFKSPCKPWVYYSSLLRRETPQIRLRVSGLQIFNHQTKSDTYCLLISFSDISVELLDTFTRFVHKIQKSNIYTCIL